MGRVRSIAAGIVLAACSGGEIADSAGVGDSLGGSTSMMMVGTGGGSTDEEPGCAADEAMCGGACVDLSNDPSHCGACDTTCDVVCVDGECLDGCPADTIECESTCVDPLTDPANCGVCEQVCAAGEMCSVGECVGACSTGETECDGGCVDTLTDDAHCGGCGQPCDAGSACETGACVAACANGILDPGESDVDCGGVDCDPCQLGQGCNAATDCATFGCDAGVCGYADSCASIASDFPALADGTYTITLGGAELEVYCDMTFEDGGWTLVLAYAHDAGQNEVLATGVAPLDPATGYSHFSTEQMASLPITELRLFCTTSAHGRVLHFLATPAALQYFQGAAGNSAANWTGGFTTYEDHTAFLPAATDEAFNQAGEDRMTNFPFYNGGDFHWGVQGLGNRWECDDYAMGPGPTTLHQIWAR